MDLRLGGKVALVTGASRGVGLAIAQTLLNEGACVAAGARDIRSSTVQVGSESQLREITVDLSELDGPSRLVDETIRAFGGLDILVNNVGAVRPRAAASLSTCGAWRCATDATTVCCDRCPDG